MGQSHREWLEADGLGGFSSGTVSGRRSQRYHALLLTALAPPGGRFVLVNGMEVTATTQAGSAPLSSQHYLPNVIHPDGERLQESFETEPWPTWIFRLPDGTRVAQEIWVPHGQSAAVLRWKLLDAPRSLTTLSLRLLMSGRDYHALHRENRDFRFEPEQHDDRLTWRPYDGVPGTTVLTSGRYSHEPLWYRQFFYADEAARGLDSAEDLASPGIFRFDLGREPALCLLSAEGPNAFLPQQGEALSDCLAKRERSERDRRRSFPSLLERSADQYLVRRGSRRTILAGYPWFTDWGRDTFLSLRGLCLATGRLEIAEEILLDWSRVISEGMVPNRFPDAGDAPEYHSVDASLWYIVAIHEFVNASRDAGRTVIHETWAQLHAAIEEILAGYAAGTRFQIAADTDGLLKAGVPGMQLTWMDAKVDDWVVTPRIGKPVEIQALWINSLWVASRYSPRWRELYTRARSSFLERFWNRQVGYLHDVVDVDHRPGKNDPRLRPNQLLAIGGLPLCLLDDASARRVVDQVEQLLYIPLGVRTLDPLALDYQPHYQGDRHARDGAYHQGTAWPWLLGPFVEAWVRVRNSTEQAKAEARNRFLPPLRAHLQEAGLNHVSEIIDAEPTPGPHHERFLPRGCPFQAWSLAELIRLENVVLKPTAAKPAATDAVVPIASGP